MEMNSNDTLGNPGPSNKINQEVVEVSYKQSVNEKFKLLFNSTDKVFHICETPKLPPNSKTPQFPVSPHSASVLGSKNDNVQHISNTSKVITSRKVLSTCNNENNCDHVKNKLLKWQLDENKPCSSESLYRNGCRPTSNRKEEKDDECISKGPSVGSNNHCKNSSPPAFTPSVETESKLAQENFFSLGYSGHWLEIKEENKEEIKDRFLPEGEVDEAGENFACTIKEMYFKSPDKVDKEFNLLLPRKTYENKNRKRYKDTFTKCCTEYSHNDNVCSLTEEATREREIPPFSSFYNSREESISNVQKNSLIASSLVSNIDCVDNGKRDSYVSAAIDFCGSWIDIKDEIKQSVEHFMFPDCSRSVEDIDLGCNEGALVKSSMICSKTTVARVNKDHSATPGKAISKTYKQRHLFLLDELRNKVVEEHENSSPVSTGTIQNSSVQSLTNHNPLSNLHFVSTRTDVEMDGVHGNTNVDFGENVHSFPKTTNSNHGNQTAISEAYDRNVKFECLTCHLFFDSIFALKNHTELHKHLDLYKCTFCKKIFKQANVLQNHVQKYNCIKFKCSSCSMKFTNKVLRQEHARSHWVDCYVCGVTCKSDKALKRHFTNIHTIKTYKCPQCNESFETRQRKNNHLRIHRSEKYPKFTCSQCQVSFIRKFSLKAHLLRVHLREKNFQCTDCGQVFVLRRQLRSHMIRHNNERPWECPVCSKRFKTKKELSNHIPVHSGEKPHACAECGRRFLRLDNLRCHMQLHSGEKKFHCEICKGSFFSRPSLLMHMARHISGLPVVRHTLKCVICCLDMRHLKTSLKIHLKQHTLKPKAIKGKFYCHVCGKKFKSKHSLGCHLNLHRTFKCVKCKTFFKNFVSFLCHSHVHLRAKKFLCNICRKEFSLMNGLVEHFKVHHGRYSYKCSVCKLRFLEHFKLVKHLKQHVEERYLHGTVGRRSFCLKTHAGSHQVGG